MIWYFYQSQNRLQKRKKKKGKIKQKREKPYLAPRRNRPTQPSRPTRGRGVFFLAPRTQAARWNATEPAGATRRRRGASRPPRASCSHLDAPWSTPPPFPPSRALLLSLPLEFVAARSFTGAHRRGRRGHRALELNPASPSCSPPSTSSSSRSWSPNSSPSRRHRLRPLAGPAVSPSSIRRR